MKFTTSLALLLLLGSVAGLAFACTATGEIPDLPIGSGVAVEAFDYRAEISRIDEDPVQSELPETPTNLHVEVAVVGGKKYAGTFAPGSLVVLPEGATSFTISDTFAEAGDGHLHEVPNGGGSGSGGSGSGGSGSGGSGSGGMGEFLASTQGWGSQDLPVQAYTIALWPADVADTQNDWDASGEFVVTAPSLEQAHAVVHHWAAARGQDHVLNSLVSINYAYVSELVMRGGSPHILATAMNDQPATVTGEFKNEDGTKTQLVWPPMHDRGSALYQSTLSIPVGLFPLGAGGYTESFLVEVEAYNWVDGHTQSLFGLNHQGHEIQ